MTNYIDGRISDEEFIGRDSRLSNKRSREDYLAAQAEGGIDAAIADSKKPERPVVNGDEGWRRPEGMSRSGALAPQVKGKYERLEREGAVEILRNLYGEIEAYRPLGSGDG
ncbi:hypothetical protein ncot_14040 [Nocardioides sp. JQ2195]|uniref:hypothetical protein n=1 Tax=Nocardioides sp. JQ2195 TaxID=2592334 RepID=UPI00143E5651|nr:hypothetical protein [Nocardioides sp. JQ2195]QIX27596.1 hypothetical protein ncot_14040 [Nocardioides sp. JQ2195]